MSAQVLSEPRRRRIEQAVGQPVDRALGFGSYVHAWRTPGAPGPHRHGWFNFKRYWDAVNAGQVPPFPPGDVWGLDGEPVMHWTTCREPEGS